MVKTLLVISLVLIVGAAGATVAAAQGSRPGEPMYEVKVWSEQARTLLQTQAQVQATQVTGQPEAGPGRQERGGTSLQTQGSQQTLECDCNQLQAQDMQQTQERIRQSQNSGQPGQAEGNPWVNDGPATYNGKGPKLGQGNNNTCKPYSQNCNGAQPNPGYGNRP